MDVFILGILALSLVLFSKRQYKHAQAREQKWRAEHGRDWTRDQRPLIFFLTPGVETFTPESLPRGINFKITLSGSYECRSYGRVTGRADTCYGAARSANFTHRYYGLRFDSCLIREEPFEEDRSRHRYFFRYVGTGKKLALLLEPPSDYLQGDSHVSEQNSLLVSILPLSVQEEAFFTAAQKQKEEERQRAATAEAEKRAAARATESQARFQELEHRYGGEDFRFLEDPTHIADHAKKYLTKLLSQRDKILSDYSHFMRDTEFIAYLKNTAPHLLARATWEWRALAHAMQLDVQQPPEPPPPPPRRKLTMEEVRALKLKRQQAQIGDKIALRKNRIEAILQVRKEMDQYDLDPDERQRLESELIEDILEEETPNGLTTKETL